MSRRMIVMLLASAVALACSSPRLGFRRGEPPTKQPTAQKATYTIYLVAGIASDAFYLTMNKGAQAEAKKLGNVKRRVPGSPTAFSPADADPVPERRDRPEAGRDPDRADRQDGADRADQAGDQPRASRWPRSTRSSRKPIAFTNISTDNVAGGKAAADALVKAIGGKGDVAAISVNPGISTTDQRQQGFEPELKKYPKRQVPRHPVRQRRPDEGVATRRRRSSRRTPTSRASSR